MTDTTLTPAQQLQELLKAASAIQAQIAASTPAQSSATSVNLELAQTPPVIATEPNASIEQPLQAVLTPISEAVKETSTVHTLPPSSGPMLTAAQAIPELPADFDAAAAASEALAKATGIADDLPAQVLDALSRLSTLEKYLPLLQAIEQTGYKVATDLEASMSPEFVAKVKGFFSKHFPNL